MSQQTRFGPKWNGDSKVRQTMPFFSAQNTTAFVGYRQVSQSAPQAVICNVRVNLRSQLLSPISRQLLSISECQSSARTWCTRSVVVDNRRWLNKLTVSKCGSRMQLKQGLQDQIFLSASPNRPKKNETVQNKRTQRC